ncbi:HAD family hydrolase [Allisonella histaminiformans]|uniref:HAD family hydrolase n=1 Tax=Allisonella histaminiformans TaxID=209880 RepID=UPI003F8B8EEA
MKKVIFDVDGVLLSEERYFDVSALTVWEWLYSPYYMGLANDSGLPLHGDDAWIAAVRDRVWAGDTLLSWLKAHGINSNWEMVHAFLITASWLMARQFREETGHLPPLSLKNRDEVRALGSLLADRAVPGAEEILLFWESHVESQVEGAALFVCLRQAAEVEAGRELPFMNLDSPFFRMHQLAFQQWYLGDEVFPEIMHEKGYGDRKEGVLQKEVPLGDAGDIRNMLKQLKAAGFSLGVATGRGAKEVEIPFRFFGWYEDFDPVYIATASDAEEVSAQYGNIPLGKPSPFLYLCAAYGRRTENYGAYIKDGRIHASDEVYVIGDSYSDVLGARAAGARFIGVLTGLTGKAAAAMFEKEKAIYSENVLTAVWEHILKRA